MARSANCGQRDDRRLAMRGGIELALVRFALGVVQLKATGRARLAGILVSESWKEAMRS